MTQFIPRTLWLITTLFSAGAMAAGEDLLRSGVASLGVGLRECGNTDDTGCGDHGGIALDVRMSFPVGSGMALQADVQTEQYSGAKEASAQSMQASTAGGHFSWRDSRYFLVGAFGGFSRSGVRDNDDFPSGATGLRWGRLYGAEAQAYIGMVTLYAQYARARYHEGDNSFIAPVYRGVVRVYPTDNLLIQGEYSSGKSDDYEDIGDWGKVRNAALEARMGVSNTMPLSVFIRHQTGKFVANTEDWGKERATFVGLAYAFGGAKSLKEQERRGAALDLPTLPSRAASWAAVLD